MFVSVKKYVFDPNGEISCDWKGPPSLKEHEYGEDCTITKRTIEVTANTDCPTPYFEFKFFDTVNRIGMTDDTVPKFYAINRGLS